MAAAACVALAACASQSGPPLWSDVASTRAPPIVLRMGEVTLSNEALPSAGGQLAGSAAAGTLIGLGYALPTLGASLLLVPLGLLEGASQAARASECGARWTAAVGDVPTWLGSTFGPVSMLSTVEEEVRLLVKPPPAVVIASATTPAAKSAELKEIGERLASPTLLVGDLWIKLEQPDQSKCGIKFAAYAQFRVQPVDQPPSLGPAYIVSVTQEDKDVAIEDWARDPERAREQLRRVLRELAARIVASYPWR
jgi:hypothetical protein